MYVVKKLRRNDFFFVGGSKQEFARGGWGLILRLGAVGGQHTCFTFNEQSY